MKLFWLKLLVISFLIPTSNAKANPEYKSGIIDSYETWSDSIIINGNVDIVSEGKVVISAGTIILFEQEMRITNKYEGCIVANGSFSDSIEFKPLDSSYTWKGILFDSLSAVADSSILNYCKISGCLNDGWNTGGAITVRSFNKLRISNSYLFNNSASNRYGGAIFADSSDIIINNCSLINNYAGNGGALYLWNSSPLLKNLVINYNRSYWSGVGIYIRYGEPVILNCKLSNNEIPSTGGEVIFIEDSETSIVNSTISHNENKAIRCYHSDISVINTVISNNGNEIGGLRIVACNPTIINSTIVNNFGYNVGGISCWYAKPSIINSIVWNNIGKIDEIYFEGEGYQPALINSNIKNIGDLGLPDSLVKNSISLDPKFIDPLLKIGPGDPYTVANWGLLSCSPLINMGSNSLLPDSIQFDISGMSRIFDDSIDIGAYELQTQKTAVSDRKILYVKNGAGGTGDSWSNALGSLQDAINIGVDCSEGIDIWLAKGTYYPDTSGHINIREASFNLRNNVAIYGGFLGDETSFEQRDFQNNESVLSGHITNSGEYTVHVYTVVRCTNLDSTAIIDGIVITESNSLGGGFDFDDGGGIKLLYSDITMRDVIIKNNYASSSGGGIYMEYSNPTINRCLIYNNNAGSYGGGLYLRNSNPLIESTRIFNNNVSGSFNGGAFYLNNSDPDIINCIITNNEAGSSGNGAGLYCMSSSPYILNSVLANNRSNGEGAAINVYFDSYPVIVNSIVCDNYSRDGLDHFAGRSIENLSIQNSNIVGEVDYSLTITDYFDNINLNPRFLNPSNKVGVSHDAEDSDWNISACSPCIDRGSVTAPSALLPHRDFAGNPRIYSDSIDIGPFEYQNIPEQLLDTIRFYVKTNGTGNGQSWSEAMGSLQDAIDLPLGCYMNKEIWVAQGTYYPDTAWLDDHRFASFILRNNTQIYGGFDTIMKNKEERDINKYETVLSGDLGIMEDNSDNSYHVVTCQFLDSTSVLDGVTISYGNSSDYFLHGKGAGVLSLSSNTRLNNLTIKDNSANYLGGGIFCSDSKITISNGLIKNNISDNNGGGIYVEESNPLILNTKISNNKSDGGGGLHFYNTRATLANCIIANNTGEAAGAIFSYGSNTSIINTTIVNNRGYFDYAGGVRCMDTMIIQNSILWGNENNIGPNQLKTNEQSYLSIRNSNIQGGNSVNLPAGQYTHNQDSVPLFNKAPIPVGITEDSIIMQMNLYLSLCSPCIEKGLNSAILNISHLDILNNPRIYGSFVDIGAYEVQSIRRYAPSDFILTNNQISEELPIQSFIGEFITYDADPNDSFNYCFSKEWNYFNYDSIYFSINEDSLLTNHIFDNESDDDYDLWIRVTDKYGCFLNKQFTIEIVDSLEINNIQGNKRDKDEIFIYPNPTIGTLNVVLLESIIQYISISDIEGKSVYRRRIDSQKETIDISSLATGIYIVKIQTDKETYIARIIIE